jgi:hypothetical protein
MKAAFGVQTILGKAETVDRSTVYEMLRYDCGRIFGLHIAVPDRFGINDHHRAVFALVETTGFVDAHFSAQSGGLGQLLELGMQIAFAVRGA